MDSRSRTWLQKNHDALLRANGCVEKLLDDLITAGIFDIIDDDYQEISVQKTRIGRLRKLLEYLPLKRSEALTAFKKAISKHCPHVLERCVEPKSRMRQLSELLTATYRTRKFSVIPAMPWLGAKGEVEVCSFVRDLMVIGRHELELARKRSEADQAPTSTDNKRKRPDRRFADEQRRNATWSSNIFCQRHRHAAGAADHDSSTDFLVTVGQEVHRCGAPLCAHRNVALWAGAGCGKTGLCLSIAQLFSSGQLWSFFGAVLLLRLWEPAIQQAMTLPDLLRTLLPDVCQEELQEFAQDLLRRNGEGLLAVLDGVDELVEKDGSFVVRLLNGDVLSKACLLATSRPCRAVKKFLDTSVFPVHVELLGFSEKQVGMFISTHLDHETRASLLTALDEDPGLASLMSIPLLAMLVCEVFKNTGDRLLSTKTKLFSALVVLVIRRAVDEKRLSVCELEEEQLGAVENVDNFPEGVAKELLVKLAKVACIAHDKKTSIVDLNLIVEEAKCKSLDFLKLGLLAEDEMKQGLWSKRLLSFRHLTIREFLTALSLSYKVSAKPSDLKQILTGLCKDASSYVVLSFLAGLLKKDHHSLLFRHLNKWLHDPRLDGDNHNDNDDKDSDVSGGRGGSGRIYSSGDESCDAASNDEDSQGGDNDGDFIDCEADEDDEDSDTNEDEDGEDAISNEEYVQDDRSSEEYAEDGMGRAGEEYTEYNSGGEEDEYDRGSEEGEDGRGGEEHEDDIGGEEDEDDRDGEEDEVDSFGEEDEDDRGGEEDVEYDCGGEEDEDGRGGEEDEDGRGGEEDEDGRGGEEDEDGRGGEEDEDGRGGDEDIENDSGGEEDKVDRGSEEGVKDDGGGEEDGEDDSGSEEDVDDDSGGEEDVEDDRGGEEDAEDDSGGEEDEDDSGGEEDEDDSGGEEDEDGRGGEEDEDGRGGEEDEDGRGGDEDVEDDSGGEEDKVDRGSEEDVDDDSGGEEDVEDDRGGEEDAEDDMGGEEDEDDSGGEEDEDDSGGEEDEIGRGGEEDEDGRGGEEDVVDDRGGEEDAEDDMGGEEDEDDSGGEEDEDDSGGEEDENGRGGEEDEDGRGGEEDKDGSGGEEDEDGRGGEEDEDGRGGEEDEEGRGGDEDVEDDSGGEEDKVDRGSEEGVKDDSGGEEDVEDDSGGEEDVDNNSGGEEDVEDDRGGEVDAEDHMGGDDDTEDDRGDEKDTDDDMGGDDDTAVDMGGDDDTEDDRDGDGDIRNERLRVCFQCAQEAIGGDINTFPKQLKLPEVVVLHHVTAADLTMLSSAIRRSSTIDELVLHFDDAREESNSEKSSRSQKQTRSAMTTLTAAIGQNRSLRTMEVCGPKYKLMERKSLANLVSNSRLVELRVWHCGVGDAEVLELSGVLQHNTKLFWLDLRGNAIGDVGMNALADALTEARKTKLAILELTDNPYSMETGARLKRRLTRIGDLYV